MGNVRDYVFQEGVKPTRAEHPYPSYSSSGVTYREEFQREDGRWVVRWTFVPNVKE